MLIRMYMYHTVPLLQGTTLFYSTLCTYIDCVAKPGVSGLDPGFPKEGNIGSRQPSLVFFSQTELHVADKAG